MARKVWIEAALSGRWTKKRQPRIPVTVPEVVEDGIAAVKAGASILHLHAYDAVTGIQNDDPDVYAAIIQGIKAEVDVIIYPTISSAAQAGSEVGCVGPHRHDPARILGGRGLLEWAIVDTGSVNFSSFDEVEQDRVGIVYMNVESDARTGFSIAEQYGLNPTMSVFEPGFIRLGAALTRRFPMLKTPLYRFMFSEGYSFGFPPKQFGLDAYHAALQDCSPGSPWMVGCLKGDITPLIKSAVEMGGHVRVGLEDSILGLDKSNAELVTGAVEVIQKSGGAIASAEDVRAEMRRLDPRMGGG